MPEDILTVPQEADSYRTLFMHGNEYISFPDINPKDGAVNNATVLHMGSLGLLELAGGDDKPLLKPYFKLDGRDVSLKLAWSYRKHWLPSFTATVGSLTVRGSIFAPPGHSGAVFLLRVKNNHRRPVMTEAGFSVNFGRIIHHIFRARQITAGIRCEFDRWTNSFLLNVGDGLPLVSLALGLDLAEPWWSRPATGGACRADAGKAAKLMPGEELVVPLYIAVNIEGSGAGTTVVDLRRHGWQALLAQTEKWLAERNLPMKQLGSAANRNLFFNYFFALGRAIDTDDWVPVTSRSPRYYVSAAFWSRDTLLWSFPGLLLCEPEGAKQVLLACYRRHLERAGEHAHYINGVLLYPGFELDQLSSYVLALKLYLQETGDRSILEEECIRRGLTVVAAKLSGCRDETTGLYETFLDPSDDPVKYPYLVYDNALAQRALEFLGALQKQGWQFSYDMNEAAKLLREAIFRYGVVEGPYGPMFAWAVDGTGRFQLYDNPPGSLQLLPHYGFCEKEEPVWQNTVRWIHSSHNPYYREKGYITGAASRHAANPWPLAAANDLLGQNLDQGRFFKRAVMDSGFCCETVSPSSGRASTGHAFASSAGFIASALWHVFGQKAEKGQGGLDDD
ncbi:glycoside hydrolase family 125 protein [Dethiobacter alkaliphilus]|uniref:Metal-independent alpha-mannosidase n=1 Tax=Dethiobacter alkaliphilus AHT 1 TaxID=555088 RepID=C0GC90_DETAL|nr:glycoside hydrolase family 125 protein [Dethiobacter alkaliphilus]EEG78825.1 conserved hypothetical protein [Dethiobacter alkaliphilus AHT 1]